MEGSWGRRSRCRSERRRLYFCYIMGPQAQGGGGLRFMRIVRRNCRTKSNSSSRQECSFSSISILSACSRKSVVFDLALSYAFFAVRNTYAMTNHAQWKSQSLIPLPLTQGYRYVPLTTTTSTAVIHWTTPSSLLPVLHRPFHDIFGLIVQR